LQGLRVLPKPTIERREIARLRRQISYYCGVIARSVSRERIRLVHAVVRRRERQLLEVLATRH
jgi:hypothetical protein